MKTNRNLLLSTSAFGLASLAALGAVAAPQAGSVIGNQAVATYTNAAGDSVTVTSNKVETVVQQVAAVSMTSDNAEKIAPGGKAFLPHIITNDGNGTDSFALSYVEGAGSFDFASVTFYADADMDGVADSTTPITSTPALAAGERFGIVIDATAPSTVTAGDSETIVVTADSVFDTGTSAVASNTDTLTVSSDAIMELVKSMVVDKSAGDPTIVDAGDTVTVTLTYSNTGLAPASNYNVEDVLDGRLPYTAGSAQWSDVNVAGGLSEANGTGIDATNGSGETIAFQANTTSNTVDFTISNVAPGRSGSVTFDVTISTAAAAGLIENTATQSDDSGVHPASNTASIIVDEQYDHVIDDSFVQADTTTVSSATDDGAAGDDVVTESTAVSQGATIAFEFVLGNSSNQTDSYALDVSNTDFPAGTTFRFVGEDGATPIVGDVGPIAAGTARKVTLLATLPSDVPPAAAAATNYTAVVSATSAASGAVNTSSAEFDGAVTAAAVDLENQGATATNADGAAPYNGGTTPWITQTADPAETVVFPMVLQNDGPTADSYNLSMAPLPDGWTYEFRLADGTQVTNSGTIRAGQSAELMVYVTPAEDAPPLTQPIDVTVTSPVSGQSDRVVNAVTVNEIVDVSITASQSAQAAPGGVVDILHTITNDGNIDITEGAITQTGLTEFSGAIYWDKNGDGLLDAGDPVVDNFNDLTGKTSGNADGLVVGETLSLIYRVQVGATPGMSESGTLSLASSLNGATKTDADTGDNAVTDQITVISGDVVLLKTQAIDPACDGNTGAFSNERQDVAPNQCIRYRIVADNTGTQAVTDVTIRDLVPAYTAYETCAANVCAGAAQPAGSTFTNSGTQISSSHGTLNPGSKATLEFTVRVEP